MKGVEDTTGLHAYRHNVGSDFSAEPYVLHVRASRNTDGRFTIVTQETEGAWDIAKIATQLEMRDGDWEYYDGAWNNTGTSYNANTWYKVKITQNVGADTFNCWIDDSTQIVVNGAFRNAVTETLSIQHNINARTGGSMSVWTDTYQIGEAAATPGLLLAKT